MKYINAIYHKCTPNGRRDTHAMAIEFQQHPSGVLECGSAKAGLLNLTIPRLCKREVASFRLGSKSVVMERYTGPNKVNPPVVICRSGPPFTDVCALQGSLERAQVVDTQWLNSLIHDPNPIEWGGYNAALARVECSPKPATTYMFGHLIDAPPSHPDTVLTTLSYLERTLTELGMKISNLSADMQLYIVATLIKWASHGNRFKSVILRPGRMHTLMSFNGCIGNLMKASGLEVLVGAAFSGLTSIMNGKAWVKSMRAFRMVTAALLYDFLKDCPKTFEDISQYLDTAREHPTGRLWVDCLIRPTLIAHQFERAERDCDYLLQQHCYQQMLPYFFAAGHWQYARYIIWHVMEMQYMLPDYAKKDLLAGAHVCRHRPGTWNSVSADQLGEQTYIKKGKMPGG